MDDLRNSKQFLIAIRGSNGYTVFKTVKKTVRQFTD